MEHDEAPLPDQQDYMPDFPPNDDPDVEEIMRRWYADDDRDDDPHYPEPDDEDEPEPNDD